MLIYNVTIQPTWAIHDTWIAWMREIHVPEVMKTGMFTHHRILRLLEVDESEGPTYAFQYFASSREKYDHYMAEHARILREKSYEKWGNQFVAFRSLMQVVE